MTSPAPQDEETKPQPRPKGTALLREDLKNSAFLNLGPVDPTVIKKQGFDFISVPKNTVAHRPDLVWRILLLPIHSSTSAIALELHGDTVVGANRSQDNDVDLDISDWDSTAQLGISRKHIQLRPSPNKLFVMDLGSTNGTRVNGLPLGVGWAYALRDDDVLTLGKLHVRVRFIKQSAPGIPTSH